MSVVGVLGVYQQFIDVRLLLKLHTYWSVNVIFVRNLGKSDLGLQRYNRSFIKLSTVCQWHNHRAQWCVNTVKPNIWVAQQWKSKCLLRHFSIVNYNKETSSMSKTLKTLATQRHWRRKDVRINVKWNVMNVILEQWILLIPGKLGGGNDTGWLLGQRVLFEEDCAVSGHTSIICMRLLKLSCMVEVQAEPYWFGVSIGCLLNAWMVAWKVGNGGMALWKNRVKEAVLFWCHEGWKGCLQGA